MAESSKGTGIPKKRVRSRRKRATDAAASKNKLSVPPKPRESTVDEDFSLNEAGAWSAAGGPPNELSALSSVAPPEDPSTPAGSAAPSAHVELGELDLSSGLVPDTDLPSAAETPAPGIEPVASTTSDAPPTFGTSGGTGESRAFRAFQAFRRPMPKVISALSHLKDERVIAAAAGGFIIWAFVSRLIDKQESARTGDASRSSRRAA